MTLYELETLRDLIVILKDMKKLNIADYHKVVYAKSIIDREIELKTLDVRYPRTKP